MRALIPTTLLGMVFVASGCGDDSPSGANGTTAAPRTTAAATGSVTTVTPSPLVRSVTTMSEGTTVLSGNVDLAADGREFVSSDVEGYDLVQGSEIRLTFDDSLSAQAGCNELNFTWSLDGDRLVIIDLGTTAIGCPPALMEQDDWLYSFLTAGPSVALDGDTLTLTGDAAVITLLDD